MSSLDFDGEIVAYAWDFEDDGKIDATEPIVLHAFPSSGNYDVRLTVTEPIVLHAFPSSGNYDVRLTVTDDDGNGDTVVHTIVID